MADTASVEILLGRSHHLAGPVDLDCHNSTLFVANNDSHTIVSIDTKHNFGPTIIIGEHNVSGSVNQNLLNNPRRLRISKTRPGIIWILCGSSDILEYDENKDNVQQPRLKLLFQPPTQYAYDSRMFPNSSSHFCLNSREDLMLICGGGLMLVNTQSGVQEESWTCIFGLHRLAPKWCCFDPLDDSFIFLSSLSAVFIANPKHGAESEVVKLICGSRQGSSGYKDGPWNHALFNFIFYVLIDRDPNDPDVFVAYISDHGNDRVRMFHSKTRLVSTLAGSGQSKATAGIGLGASFNGPSSLTWMDSSSLIVPNRYCGSISVIRGLNQFEPLLPPAYVSVAVSNCRFFTFA